MNKKINNKIINDLECNLYKLGNALLVYLGDNEEKETNEDDSAFNEPF